MISEHHTLDILDDLCRTHFDMPLFKAIPSVFSSLYFIDLWTMTHSYRKREALKRHLESLRPSEIPVLALARQPLYPIDSQPVDTFHPHLHVWSQWLSDVIDNGDVYMRCASYIVLRNLNQPKSFTHDPYRYPHVVFQY